MCAVYACVLYMCVYMRALCVCAVCVCICMCMCACTCLLITVVYGRFYNKCLIIRTVLFSYIPPNYLGITDSPLQDYENSCDLLIVIVMMITAPYNHDCEK